jgi:biotin carboxylase
MSKIVIFVGYIRQAYLEYFVEKGYTIGLFADSQREKFLEQQDIESESKIDFILPFDFSSKENIENTLKNTKFNKNSILLCLNDRYFLATSYIANFLGLKQKENLPLELAKNVTDKMYQRKLFKKTFPEITPPYKTIKNFHDAYLFARKYGFPIIIKPANLSQSQLVNICNNLEELIVKTSYVLDTVAEVYKKNQVHTKPVVGVEKYVQGKQYSVDSYVSLDGEIVHTPVCEQKIGYDFGSDNFETLYSNYTDSVNEEEQKLIFETVSKAIKSLNIKGNPTHTEVRLTPEGECKVIEVNIRTGGYRAEMLKYSYGINHVENVINTYLNKPVKISNKLIQHSSCPQFWSPIEGQLKAINGFEEAKKLESCKRLLALVKVGDKVGPSEMGYSKCVFAVLANEDKQKLEQDIEKIRQIISFETIPLKQEKIDEE